MIALGFDTSNYTTSAAVFNGTTGNNYGELLHVKAGELGLRQSDALFQHVKCLPNIVEHISKEIEINEIGAVGASTRPRAVEGSYMPCFLSGESQARVLANVIGVPFYAFSHQQGHIAAVLWSSGKMDLLEKEYLAWHLSGGTTELLYVTSGISATKIGGTNDISAGQLLDRTGQMLGVEFPAGKALDQMAIDSSVRGYRPKVHDMEFSLSGMQNKVKEQIESGTSPADVARFSIVTCINAIKEATHQAQLKYGKELPVVFTGGVSSNSLLRKAMFDTNSVFGEPKYSTDNAMGIAVLTYVMEKRL